jgi:predicted ATPase
MPDVLSRMPPLTSFVGRDLVLRQCAGVRVLATSREALGADGERAWLIPLLSVPGADDGIDAISESEAVGLFVDRARGPTPRSS